MRVASLPSPGFLSNGIRIRIEAAKAISAVEINAGYGAGKSPNAKPLADFFTACIAAISGMYDTVVPVIAARSISLSNTERIVLTYGEGLNPKFVPAVTDFAITGQVRAVTEVTIDGPFVYLDVATAFVAGAVSVAYTQGAIPLQDISGGLAASFTAAAVTNAIA